MVFDRARRVQELFEHAADLAPQERDAFLEAQAGGDAGLLSEVRELLAADDEASRFLQGGALVDAQLGAVGEEPIQGHWIGRSFGPYTAIHELGRGGMGVVLLGERSDGKFEGNVAIKVVHTALVRGELVDRFRTEGRILAEMDHPHVARLLDAGDTDDGLSYIIMEYVDGPRLDVYADEHLLDVPARLRLFRSVLDGVDYAHARGIIHRDLKPSNILVTQDGQPKLVDFGIAKLLTPSGTDEATIALTRTSSRMMTPEYASPEQVKGLPVEATTDVYSLGVVLYRLLTGRPPYALPTTQLRAAEQIICEEEPRRPSTAVTLPASTAPETTLPATDSALLARNRSSTRDRLQRRLRGDLDTIVLKALSKDPGHRYATAGAFGDDIERHLAGEAIRARGPSLVYRATKFARRRRVPIAVSAVVLAGLGTAAWQASVADRERAAAQANTAELADLVQTITRSVNLGQREEQGATATREAQVAAALESLEAIVAQTEGNPDPDLLYQLAGAYRELAMLQGYVLAANLGQVEEATANLLKAIELDRRIIEIRPDNAAARNSMGQIQAMVGDQYRAAGDSDRGLAMYEESLETLLAVQRDFPDNARALDGLGATYSRLSHMMTTLGRFEEALEYQQGAIDVEIEYARITPNNDRRTAVQDIANARMVLANFLAIEGRLPEALDLDGIALTTVDSLVADDPSERTRFLQSTSYTIYANHLARADRLPEAERFARMAVDVAEELSLEDPSNVQARNTLGLGLTAHSVLLDLAGRPDEALVQADWGLELLEPPLEAQFALYAPAVADLYRARGAALDGLGRFNEAEAALGRARELADALLEGGGMSVGLAYATKSLASTLQALQRHHTLAARTGSESAHCAQAGATADSSATLWADLDQQGHVRPGEQQAWDLGLGRIPQGICS